ncbi:MAG: hypothetical protein CGU28_04155 [Candidatus Dactylopiibacterium carminicum]|uniref:DUF6900 domain-containing protein n=1 Tax=Candidatus Dactylopiibacterium carminicum TaxID=857335 RepID=A0A272EXI7_9RHOO|nr:hypothetical protein [Candidatus Dactylopiibacterium carminicum]KAF7600169.1 hypothetical protein BGI27_03685 [Candidatus Dactylopiibacterium carminicum]PAS94811.1 MAG: hypothetical protein CGU29_02620 [Candidatus Dactylopiibacterium carminicum]PAS97735.1 MAG: hypothetical protein CGU28_04155 [Candidatus Dactylopiibacterium carminicum]PAT00172.1 MAG: hypothetical protein BSR46_03710 [Candidatus Dactylopiibacterium carminicum]
MAPQLDTLAQAEIAHIARTQLQIEALASDSLDFHDLSATSIKAALEAAYIFGMVDHMKR